MQENNPGCFSVVIAILLFLFIFYLIIEYTRQFFISVATCIIILVIIKKVTYYFHYYEKRNKIFEEKKHYFNISGYYYTVTYKGGNASIAKGKQFIWRINNKIFFFPACPQRNEENYVLFEVTLDNLEYYLMSFDIIRKETCVKFYLYNKEYTMFFHRNDYKTFKILIPDNEKQKFILIKERRQELIKSIINILNIQIKQKQKLQKEIEEMGITVNNEKQKFILIKERRQELIKSIINILNIQIKQKQKLQKEIKGMDITVELKNNLSNVQMSKNSKIVFGSALPNSWQTQEFYNLVDSYIYNNCKWDFDELGIINWNLNTLCYSLLVDNKIIIIDKQLKFMEFYLSEINNLFFYSMLDKEKIKKIAIFQDLARSKEKEAIEELNNLKENLTTNKDSYQLLTGFLQQYYKELYKNIEIFYAHEDDLLSIVFCRPKQFEFEIIKEARKKIENNLQMLFNLFIKKGYLDEKLDKGLAYILFLKALKNVALNYYSNEFEQLYGGYFPSIQNMSIDECITAYYQIDFINKKDKNNIGFLTYFLFKNNKFKEYTLLSAFNLLKEKVVEMEKNIELLSFENQLLSNNTKYRKSFENISIDNIDLMSGTEFENFLYDLFKRMGYTVNLTPASGDQGIDIIAVKNGLRIGIQAKCYSNAVSNKAIQEVVAGMKYYSLSKAIVITNNYFTKSAIKLAQANEVVLWDRTMLKEKIKEFY